MTLAMTLGMSIGLRRTFWMMLGEVTGVALVAIAAVLGVANIMLNYPNVFLWLKWLGGAYLVYLGISSWRAKAHIDDISRRDAKMSNSSLISQGFITAIANPKGWGFMISILPPFVSLEKSIATQLFILVGIIMICEFICMMLYASGGKSLRALLNKGDNIRWLNRIAGSLLVLVGVWLALG